MSSSRPKSTTRRRAVARTNAKTAPAPLAAYADLPLYRQPQIYDVAFGFRDVPSECDGILKLAHYHGLTQPRTVLELACGPAHHLRGLVRKGLKGIGVDINAGMLRYAAALCRRDHLAATFRRADLRTFHLPVRVDLALCLFDSFGLCVSDRDAVGALRSTAAVLKRGGLFILEFSHPIDFFGSGRSRTRDRWTEHDEQLKVAARFSFTRLDAVGETFVAHLTLQPSDRKTHAMGRRMAMRWQQRMWFRSALQHVVHLSGCFDIAGWHGDIDPRIALTSAAKSWRMLLVLRRR